MSHYSFADYSDAWPALFGAEAKRLATLLGDTLVTVYHIGSTSVPGLPAKPIIDLLPIVRQIEQVDTVADNFLDAGYRAWGEYGLSGRRLFTKDSSGTRTHNVHIYAEGHQDVERHVAFSAYLRAHPKLCDEYAELKREAYARYPDNIEAYNDHKDAWIKSVEREAMAWRRANNA